MPTLTFDDAALRVAADAYIAMGSNITAAADSIGVSRSSFQRRLAAVREKHPDWLEPPLQEAEDAPREAPSDDDAPEAAPPAWGATFNTDAPDAELREPAPAEAASEKTKNGNEFVRPEAFGVDSVATERRKARKAKAGANSDAEPAGDNISKALVSFVERVERLAEEKSAIAEDIKEVFGEARAQGYNVAVMRKVIARRAMDPAKRAELDALIETYEEALR